jgi:hypothetical protein
VEKRDTKTLYAMKTLDRKRILDQNQFLHVKVCVSLCAVLSVCLSVCLSVQ